MPTTAAENPDPHTTHDSDATVADDGLFGPASVTWRLFDSPAVALSTSTAILAQMLLPRSPGWSTVSVVKWLVGRVALDLLPADQRRLYGVRWTRLDPLTAEAGARLLVRLMASNAPPAKHLATLRADAMAHAFGGRQRRR